ncbi:MlaD family protein [Marinobacter sp. Arc7-DN-1]|uniref:MlaD family protein n=1 Tax=Marinobacter sp. Arc7-DN-1 TaxID=2304594 RepID=UPI000E45283F|nr:MlaD family protein [Marinobacter sp. Arc7-DN-1]AXS81789.1 MCE family protein [Marinobacter sp. Arc7-DN-1]
MEPRAHHLIIGLFTIIAFGAALIFSLWLAKSSADREWAYYEIVFDHAVSGLAEGNPVLYSGVQVGDVMALTLDSENPGRVRVLVRVDQSVPIRDNTKAGLVLANITGSMSVQFSGGSPDRPALKGNRDNPPLIVAEPSTFNSLLANGHQLLAKADLLLSNATELLSGDNIENLTAILRNTREATDALLARREQLSALLDRLDAAGSRTAEAAIKVSRVSDNANELLQTDGRRVLQSMDKTLGIIYATISRIDQLTRDNRGAMDSGLQGMGELAPALRELRATLRNLNQFTQRLEEDPTGTLFGNDTMKELSK